MELKLHHDLDMNFLQLATENAIAYPEESTNREQPTILFAEDNDDLREVTTYFLSTEGFNVVACSDGALASQAFSHFIIDMLLTDLEMPGRSGIELARELTALQPSLPVMIVSGSIISDELEGEMKSHNWTFMRKPCRLPTLLASLHLALQSRQGLAALRG